MLIEKLSAPHDWRALEAKWMGVGRLNHNSLHRRIGQSNPSGQKRRLMIDILCIPFEQWGAALLYFTGNDIVRLPTLARLSQADNSSIAPSVYMLGRRAITSIRGVCTRV